MNNYKKILMFLVPPILLWGCRKLFGIKAGISNIFFEGIYPDFDELKNQLDKTPQYYWPGAIQQEVEAQLNRMAAWASACPPQGNYRTNFLSALLTLYPEGRIHVLDIGGGLNNVYEYLKFSLKKDIHVTVVDQLPAVENGILLYKDDSALEFLATWPERGDVFDIAYLGSSIQYFPDYRKLMKDIAHLAPKLIVVADSSFGMANSFACRQVNMPGAVIPYWVINRDEFEATVQSLGYERIHRSMNGDALQHFDNYEYPYNSTRSWNFVFRKIEDSFPKSGASEISAVNAENI